MQPPACFPLSSGAGSPPCAVDSADRHGGPPPVHRRLRALLCAAACIVLLRAAAGLAAEIPSVPAISEVGGGIIRLNDDVVVGWKFRVGASIHVTHLAVYDENGNGVLDEPQPPPVGIWDSSQNLLVSTTIPLDTPVDVDGFFYQEIAPISLPAGTYIIALVNYQGGEEYRRDSTIQIDSRIEWREGRYAFSGQLSYPTEVRTTPSAFFGPSFQFYSDPVTVTTPSPRSVFQRNDGNRAEIEVSGTYGVPIDSLEIEAEPMPGFSGTPLPRQPFDADIVPGSYSGTVSLRGGWYRITVAAIEGGEEIATATAHRIGVGEVFVTVGQSNSASHGWPPQTPADDRVNCTDYYANWRHADDPQPIATGTGGSPWPAFGDALAAALDVPIGLLSVGYGGSPIGHWYPGQIHYPRLQAAMEHLGPGGCRAVFWHQGETDSINGTGGSHYASDLRTIIGQSRVDAGFDVPWGVAIASWYPDTSSSNQAQVRAGQWEVINGDPLVFLGSETDDFHNLGYLHDHVHYNADGLTEHGLQWADRILDVFFPDPTGPGRITRFVRVAPNRYLVEWEAESGVSYELQRAPGAGAGPVDWSPVGDWVVGPQNHILFELDPADSHAIYRIAAP